MLRREHPPVLRRQTSEAAGTDQERITRRTLSSSPSHASEGHAVAQHLPAIASFATAMQSSLTFFLRENTLTLLRKRRTESDGAGIAHHPRFHRRCPVRARARYSRRSLPRYNLPVCLVWSSTMSINRASCIDSKRPDTELDRYQQRVAPYARITPTQTAGTSWNISTCLGSTRAWQPVSRAPSPRPWKLAADLVNNR